MTIPSRVELLTSEAERCFAAAGDLLRLSRDRRGGRARVLLDASTASGRRGEEFLVLAGGCVDSGGGPPASPGSTEPLAGGSGL